MPGALPASLAAAGIEPSEADTVVLTHLHTDRVGWAVVGGEQTRPFFPNAAYLLQQAELNALEEINPQLRSAVIDPLPKAGQLRLLDGDTPLRSGERVFATHGHTPGHQSVLVASGRELVAVPVTCSCTRSRCFTPNSPTLTKWTPGRQGPQGNRCSRAGPPTLSPSRPRT